MAIKSPRGAPIRQRGGNSLQGKVKSDFPKHRLDQGIRVAQAIEETNGGRPMPVADLAIALGISPGSSDLRAMASSSLKYGVTSGSYKQERISLTPLGARVVSPSTPEDKHQAEVEAALTPRKFRAIYEHFRGKKLPDLVFFQNAVVREFEIPREHAARCVDIFVANMERVGLVRVASTGKWLSTDAAPPAPDTGGEELHREEPGEPRVPPGAWQNEPAGVRSAPATAETQRSAIFIGHGKNKKPLEQLKQILDHYKIPYRVAVDEANRFRPISDKVADTMNECGAAILIFTADEEFKNAKDEIVWRPSENVVHELGAASVLYRGRIIIFREQAVDLPTNFSGIGYITFSKDDLAAKAHDLFRELVSFGLIRISVGG